MTEKQREKMNEQANEHGDNFCLERDELWWMRTSDYKSGYTAAHNDANAIIKKLERSLKLIALENIYVGENGWRDEYFLNVKQANEALAELNKWRQL